MWNSSAPASFSLHGRNAVMHENKSNELGVDLEDRSQLPGVSVESLDKVAKASPRSDAIFAARDWAW